jgi:uncharacterized protein YhbP (UPF0306 family)
MTSVFDTETVIREYINDVIHMSVSTSRNNKPWTCEVHFSYDGNLNLYFYTKPSRRHSKDIHLNPQVSGSIVRQHQVGEKPRGVYFEGLAERVEGISMHTDAFKSYNERFGVAWESVKEQAAASDGHVFYHIRVSDWYVFDAIESKPSQKYHIGWHS